jgi:hypothetical protein
MTFSSQKVFVSKMSTTAFPHTLTVTVCVPTHVSSWLPHAPLGKVSVDHEQDPAAGLSSSEHQRTLRLTSLDEISNIVWWNLDSSRLIWNEIVPILFFPSSKQPGRRLILILLRHVEQCLEKGGEGSPHFSPGFGNTLVMKSTYRLCQQDARASNSEPLFWGHVNVLLESDSDQQTIQRTFHLQRRKCTKQQRCQIFLIVTPPSTTLMEKSWEYRLVSWEHLLIQAYSVSAYLATLGGGHFLCRQLSTALKLAQYQQYVITHVLHGSSDQTMLFKCILNQAYNYMYAGHFKMARKILRYIQNRCFPTDNRRSHEKPAEIHDQSFLRMYQNARITCRRMQNLQILPVEVSQQETQLEKPSSDMATEFNTTVTTDLLKKQSSLLLTHDNWYRYRIVQDQSSRT